MKEGRTVVVARGDLDDVSSTTMRNKQSPMIRLERTLAENSGDVHEVEACETTNDAFYFSRCPASCFGCSS